MGRTLTITVHKASGLDNADAAEGGLSDPFVQVSFDADKNKELGRTEIVENSLEPVWEHTLEIDISSHIKDQVDGGEDEPNMITFSIFDGDVDENEPIGVAGLLFSELLKSGVIEEKELPVYMGSGTVTVSASLKKVKKSSMLSENANLKIAGGVLGAAAVGALGIYLFNRYQKKKDALGDDEDARTGMAYGYLETDEDEEDEELRGQDKKWWEMDDEESDDDDEDKWDVDD